MAGNARVIVVCARQADAENIAFSLRRQGLDAIAFGDAKAALAEIRRDPVDMILSEANLTGYSGLAFLAQTRREAPLAQRVLLDNAAMPDETRRMVNEAGPCAVVSGAVESARILELIAIEGPVTHRVGAIFGPAGLETERIESENRNLANQNRLLLKEFAGVQRARAQIQARLTKLEALTGTKTERTGAHSPPAGAGETSDPRIHAISVALDRMIEDPNISLPVVPAVGNKIRNMLTDKHASFDRIAEMIKLESGMSARILHVANSPLYAGLERIRSLPQAMSRLGLRETLNVVQAIVGENLFKTQSPYMARLMLRLWMHSLCCAYANEQIARSLEIPDSDDYFIMGLLHDIGKLLVIHLVERGIAQKTDWAAEGVSEGVVLELMNRRHHDYGRLLMENWNYPSVFADVAMLHDDADSLAGSGEPVIVTYFSNLLSRKLGYSLVPYDGDPLSDHRLAEALNVNQGMRLALEDNIIQLVEKIRETFFPGK
ncbi:HDOD domain-containing protein [Candidatus Sumerlaeota bacterium]|nr:HDOD domain-containing protein [Candidatus Sumerlaeota bacterium]